jgi:imidazolonepropionase-like amidohydrolase
MEGKMAKTAIRAGWLWTGTGDEAIPDGALLIDGERIVAVGPRAAVEIPPDAELIERPGEFLMPGLIDAHTHLTIVPGLGNQSGQKRRPIERQTIRAVGNLRRTLRSGVTTARIMGEENWLDVTFREEIEAGEVPGPRLIVATRAITPSNGHGRAVSAFDGVDEVRKGARENLIHGADFLKVFLTGGISSTRGSLQHASYTRAELDTIVEEAERAGTYVAAHAVSGRGISFAAEAGVRTIEHAALATDEDLALIREKGAWVVLTQGILLHPTGIEQGERERPAIMARLHEARSRAAERFRTIVGSGVRYAVGTDSMHGLLWFECAKLVEWGASPAAALRAATVRAAECCRVEDRVGTLEAGKLADVVTVRGNPLKRIDSLAAVGLVVKGGRRYEHLSIE